MRNNPHLFASEACWKPPWTTRCTLNHTSCLTKGVLFKGHGKGLYRIKMKYILGGDVIMPNALIDQVFRGLTSIAIYE